MHAIRKLKRWIALVVLAALAFSQASLAIAGCELDRRALTPIKVTESAKTSGCDMDAAGHAPFSTNRCALHCTADLQIAGMAVAIVRDASESSMLQLPRSTRQHPIGTDWQAPPSPAVPIRILLHSFLV